MARLPLSAFFAGAPAAHAFDLTSADLRAGAAIPQSFAFKGFGCTGDNVSPALDWSNPPADSKSFAVFVHDPDAKTGGAGFWHWVVADIPVGTSSLPRGTGTADGARLPAGARQIATDFGVPGWGGPCPPTGDAPHRYIFTVYALKTEKLELPPNPTASLTGFVVNMNAIASASFTATYGR
ncbi:YbhB/YbcL family Raf kinase inhibitor-like protein [Bosea sp. (in: a-proteobacteria)]|uniref:YbhB/YbcL family Raf kinase inhibitor-like protein n=1 Tax=Bosea sp. (in: a-proteobacteria) TaxID=1871050 RepID=UPI002B4617EC|nr:YbhB/YbcL family Raf kinase inhibitor-like protein [Bosea sp. (in: a-proteobacteria)]WRH60132.1 MAG: YbhB/YbcL family Raf kinase inhibitor-like protein [Bosea sp. (in: a-proteobacteria)]